MKLNTLKKIAISSLAIAVVGAGIAFAATPIAQTAYYDTFTFKVNNNAPMITDGAKKPFIANSRVYVPISTLSDMGICQVAWTPAANGMAAELNITPASSADSAKEAYYETKIKQLADDIAKKDAEIKTLTEDNKKLKDENEKSKSNQESKSSNKSLSQDEIDELKKKSRDLAYDYNRDRGYNTMKMGDKNIGIEYDFYFGTKSLEVSMYMDIDDNNVETLKKDYARNVDRLVENLVYDIQRNTSFKNVDIYTTVYKGRTNSTKLADYDAKDGRDVRGGFTL